MVSIPDWARVRGITENRKEVLPSTAKYEKQRTDEAIKLAEEHGYFLKASRQFIEDKYVKDNTGKKSYFGSSPKEKDLRVVQMIKLTEHHLRGVGDIGLCTNIQICVLSNNYITKFDALAGCVHLVKLDLHSNQITTLPGPSFWAGMRRLCVLNLHDNPIGRIENLHYLASCPSLLALTLNNTPLSLKRNYRHHVVNSIWALRALDSHVISDEEIIEDANFGGSFSSLHPSFKISLCLSTSEDVTCKEELDLVRWTVSQINHIMAHGSPVLIIQRHIRGYLLRKRYKMVQDMRIWAAVTIQRTFREWKGIETAHTHIPPPPTPATEAKSLPKPALVLPQTEPLSLDYDTYMRHRRPGSVGLSEAGSGVTPHAIHNNRQVVEIPGRLPSTPVESMTPDLSDKSKKNIYINLAKLQTGTLYSLQDEMGLDTALSSDRPTGRDYRTYTRPDTKKVKKRKSPREERKRPVIKTVRQFFGPVVDSVPTPEPGMQTHPSLAEDDQEIPVIDFRLRGRHQTVQFHDPTTDMILAKREAGKEVRAAEDEYHRQIIMAPKPPPKVPSQTNDQRMFARVQGTMGLTCLQAIQQAYKDREKAEKRVAKLETVMSMKEERDAAKDRIRNYQEEKRNRALRDREQDQRKILERMEKIEQKKEDTLHKYNEIRKRSSNFQKLRRGELTFISDFNVQNTSVSNALLRHDRQARVEDQMADRTDRLQAQREVEKEQQDVVKKYMEHRQLMRQTESAMSRAAVDTKMLQEANDRLMMAKTRVAQQKSMNASVQAFYPLPALTNQSLPQASDGQASSVSLKNFEKWNKLNRNHTVATM